MKYPIMNEIELELKNLLLENRRLRIENETMKKELDEYHQFVNDFVERDRDIVKDTIKCFLNFGK